MLSYLMTLEGSDRTTLFEKTGMSHLDQRVEKAIAKGNILHVAGKNKKKLKSVKSEQNRISEADEETL